jgi:primosomal protein N'
LPHQEEADQNSEDAMSDDELEVNSNNFGKILKTRMGAGPEKNNHAQTGVNIEGADNVEGDDYNVAANVREAFDFAHGMWQIPAESNEDMSPAEATVSAEDLEKALTAATASQKQDFHTNRQTAKLVEPSLRASSGYSSKEVWSWYRKKKEAKNEKGQPSVKAAQLKMLHVVCQRLCDELDEVANEQRRSEPLMWLLHGLPGTGKSEVLMMLKELFEEVCGWQMGLEYQMVALQAVMAQLLGGDTIHHAMGIPQDCV